jgi:hypothetical protein
MEQTKGYLRLEGKIWGLNNKEPFANSVKKSLSFGLQSSKTNTNYVQVGDWISSKLNVKIKANPDDEVTELGEQEAIDFVKANFKDGDCVYLNIRVDVDTYHKKLVWIISQMYKKSEAIDFDAEGFEEVNELNQAIIITEKPSNGKVKAGVTTYKGEMIELELALEDEVVKEYFEENAKVGDLMHVTIDVDNRPIYEEGQAETGEPSKERTTLKGKKLGGNNTNKSYKKIKERELVLSISDVDTEKTEKGKYTRDDIREAIELVENKPVKNTNSSKTTGSGDIQPVDDGDLPF